MSFFSVIVAGLALLTAVVRWRHDLDVRRLDEHAAELRSLRREISQLRAKQQNSVEEREELYAENRKLAATCDQQQIELGQLRSADQAKGQQIEEMAREIDQLKRQIRELMDAGGRSS